MSGWGKGECGSFAGSAGVWGEMGWLEGLDGAVRGSP